MDRQVERREQSRRIVLEQQLAVVEVSDGFGERQSEAGPLVGAARIEASEAAPGFVPARGRDAWPAVGDLDPDPPFAGPDAGADLAAARPVAAGVFDAGA